MDKILQNTWSERVSTIFIAYAVGICEVFLDPDDERSKCDENNDDYGGGYNSDYDSDYDLNFNDESEKETTWSKKECFFVFFYSN